VFAFAGLWEQWRGEGGEVIDSCTILTTVANEVLLPVHDRMPVILHPEDYGLWLGEDARKVDLLKGLLRPFPSGEMTSHAVSARVNSPTAQGAGLVAQYNSA
ncbi:MAG: SOS response-associated peptidase, partial [Pyrinomonadaceae bacterium]